MYCILVMPLSLVYGKKLSTCTKSTLKGETFEAKYYLSLLELLGWPSQEVSWKFCLKEQREMKEEGDGKLRVVACNSQAPGIWGTMPLLPGDMTVSSLSGIVTLDFLNLYSPILHVLSFLLSPSSLYNSEGKAAAATEETSRWMELEPPSHKSTPWGDHLSQWLEQMKSGSSDA